MTVPVTSLQLEHIPHPHSVYIALFKNVKNAPFLRDQLLAGNAEFEYAFIDATTVISKIHALAAAHQAVHNLLVGGKLRTRNVHSETVFCLSPNNNITDAFRRFEFTNENLLEETAVDWAKVGKNYKIKSDKLDTQSMMNERIVGGLNSIEVEILGKLVVRTAG